LLSKLLSKQESANSKSMKLTDSKYENMVPRGGLEPPAHGFSDPVRLCDFARLINCVQHILTLCAIATAEGGSIDDLKEPAASVGARPARNTPIPTLTDTNLRRFFCHPGFNEARREKTPPVTAAQRDHNQ
jgi:hypothetical protein